MFDRIVAMTIASFAVILTVAMSSDRAAAQGCCGGGGHDHGSAHDDSHESSCHEGPVGPPPPLLTGPHDGQFLIAGDSTMEVVMLPQELRVYLYGKGMEPRSTQSFQARLVTQLARGGEKYPTLLQFVPRPPGSKEQDYLRTPLDTQRLAEGQTTIAFEFENFPDQRHPKAGYTFLFLQEMVRPHVAAVPLMPGDHDGIAGQQNCPVTGARLGSMGPVVKLLVGDRPLYLCCAGCVARVKEVEAHRNAPPPSPVASQ